MAKGRDQKLSLWSYKRQ